MTINGLFEFWLFLMKISSMKSILILVISIIFFTTSISANPGDTLLVKTFTFDSIHTRRAIFPFPEPQNWEKILMYYTIKCDAATPWDQYPCGEWDYTTYTNVYEHTGMLDSTLYYHKQFTWNNYPFDIFYGTISPKYRKVEKSFIENTYQYTSFNSYAVGFPWYSNSVNFDVISGDAKLYCLYDATKLLNCGLPAGNINELVFRTNYSQIIKIPVKIRLAQANITQIDQTNLGTYSFTTVFEGEIYYGGITEEIKIPLQSPYYYSGNTGLIVEVSIPEIAGNFAFGTEYGDNMTTLFAGEKDYYINFENFSYVDVPASVMPDVNNEISICMWAYGNEAIQPQNDMLLEAYDSNGRRQLCVHYPWSNGNIYWDAGNTDNSYDRIDKAALTSEYEGRWNHLAFTKNTVTGSMKIYINGQLWHSGTGKTKPISDIETFILGCNASKDAGYSYDGKIDDFSVWNKELSQTEIQALMVAKPDNGFTAWNNLLVYYDFDEQPGSGYFIHDYSENQIDAQFWGTLSRTSYRAYDRFKYFEPGQYLPAIQFNTGSYSSISTQTKYYTDSIPLNQQIIREFQNSDPYTIEPLETSVYYPDYELITHLNGLTDTIWYTPDLSIANSNLEYYGQAYEVINTIQIQNYVTPYGINLSLGTDGFTHVYDVSDYVQFLHGMVDLQAHNTQELIDVTFMFIEGTPPRDVLQCNQVYLGNFGQYNIVNDISLKPKKIQRHEDAETYRLKARTTGHGMEGAGNCAEFCPTMHHVSVNEEQVFEWQNWKKCAINPIFPQGGTWIFDRAGWCPGSFADTYDIEISDYVAATDSIELDYGMVQHPVGNGEGNFNVSLQLIQYSAPNFQNDAAIVDVTAPNKADLYRRYNPICKHPEIVIKNTGANALHSLNVEYGLNGDYSYSYQWMGDLNFLETDTVQLPVIAWTEFILENTFNVRISQPNQLQDEYPYNNTFSTTFNTVDIYPVTNVLIVKTNNYGNETHYQVLDSEGNILIDRDNLTSNTSYSDTLDFAPGCYEIRLWDRGEDGLHFWYWDDADGTGYMKLRKVGAGYIKNFLVDFGSFIYYQFVIPDVSYIEKYALDKEGFTIYPNPSDGNFKIDLLFEPDGPADVCIFDMSGRQVLNIPALPTEGSTLAINLNDIVPGFYIISLKCGSVFKTQRMIIE